MEAIKKYELTSNSIEHNGVTLYQIKAMEEVSEAFTARRQKLIDRIAQIDEQLASQEQTANAIENKRNSMANQMYGGAPVKVGHHSEGKHRSTINNLHKLNDAAAKSNELRKQLLDEKERLTKQVENLKPELNEPEYLEYIKGEVERLKTYHSGLKSGAIPKEHYYSLTYAKQALNKAEAQLKKAIKLWGAE